MSLTSLEDPKDIILNSTSYYSDTGNIDLWDSLFPIKINMPICAPLDDDTENAEKFLLRGNHEDLAGHSRGLNDPKHIKRIVGDIVIANIIYRSSLMGIHFDIEWKNDIVLRGTHAMKTYCASGVKPLRTRNFLSTDQKINCFFCKSSSEILKLNVFNSDNFF
jgi:hypothetical protein